MKSWLGLVNERNGLVRKTSELSLRMKELELEDRQYEVDKKLNALCSLQGWYSVISNLGLLHYASIEEGQDRWLE